MPCTVRHLFAMVWYPAAHIHCGKSWILIFEMCQIPVIMYMYLLCK
jgi:hypothetical protein